MVNWFQVILLGLVVGIASVVFNLPFGLCVAFIVAIGLLSIANMLYKAYFSTNMKQVKKYIENHKKDPFMKYMLTLENGTKGEELAAMDDVIAHYKQPSMQNTFEMNRAILLADYKRASEFAEKLKNAQLRTFGKAIIAAVQGNEEQLAEYDLKREWMKYAVEAELALAKKEQQRFEQASVKAVNASKGFQRFLLIHSFKKSKLENGWS
ncbi:hypothetical protein CSE16_12150 [Solibacillus sp. R5-41]|uniref:hypothetical protein n=1 Tax=Solibacillus sp. R5-41 TaxID=2048654 RepID=UPI000C1264D2|nr:hypothetical protein [Solibacillus sp. R5-41]ATP40739.1 hypothetical protein CSE16_12150 [Solibacillus sp. R5-41]